MKLHFKLRFLCGILALSLFMTACGSATGQGTETGSTVDGAQNVSVKPENTEVVGNAADETSGNTTETQAPTLTAEELEWQDKLMAKVEESLNVRAEANAEAEVVGLLAKGDLATVLEVGDAWTKISSGNVEGYVSNEYCVYGLDALAYAKEILEVVAVSNAEYLNVRAEMNTECAVIDQVAKDGKILVDTDAEVEDGWVAVRCAGHTAYVSADYVTVGLNVGAAMTMDEIYAMLAAEEAEREREAAAQAATNSGATVSPTGNLVSSASDLELLAAIIMSEAGNQPYETQLGVGAVIVNRTRSGIFPNTIVGVIFQAGQFTPITNGTFEYYLSSGNIFSSCYQAAQEAMAGADNTGGCLYFNNVRCGRNGLRMGDMVFWRTW